VQYVRACREVKDELHSFSSSVKKIVKKVKVAL
jgi:hypothetical protein